MATNLCPQCGFDMVHIPTQGDRARLRARLSVLDSVIAALTAERDTLRAQSDGMVYPVLSLPHEITSEIFKSCVAVSSASVMTSDPGRMLRPIVLPRASVAPLLLLRICRQWREIAASTPRLWTSLSILESVPREVVGAWFARAGNLPLDYRLYHNNGSADSLVTDSLLYASRWENVGFRIPLTSVPQFNLVHQPFPHLRKFTFETYHTSTNASIPTPSLAIRCAPLLREVHLSNIPRAVQLDIPWAQLTHLKFNGMDIAQSLSIIAGCSQLQYLDAFTAGATNSILQYLILPRLEKLALHGGRASPGQQPEIIDALVRRSTFPLRVFAVYNGPTTLEHLRLYLHALPPSVTRLVLMCGNYIDSRAMFALLRSPDLFPNLKQLIVNNGDRISGEHYQSFVDVLRGRASVLELADLSLIGPRPLLPRVAVKPSMAVMDQIRVLAAGGMKIRVKTAGQQDANMNVVYDSIG
ncbi:hypothetical protein FB45DRAFT_1143404 [Roridomyces roridus]|uniref:F-box domain-containing protein n=1 Tax=Roridomyces roridus TaxID=1738132 RepID=A0AAD7C0C3_9AGAR|nr:hypothetical protein FB45DRAFT_1143404 [Roridomyces roridus]